MNNLRADFRSYQSRPASESEHKRTVSALDVVVAGINKVVQRQQEQQRVAEQNPCYRLYLHSWIIYVRPVWVQQNDRRGNEP